MSFFTSLPQERCRADEAMAARLLGIGSENMQTIPVDGLLRIGLTALERRIEAGSRCGAAF